MSIDELGRGLVNESRKVRRRQRERQERYEQMAAIAQITLPIGAKIIEDGLMQKAQDFFQSEEVLNLKRQQDRAIRHQAETYAVEEAIAASGGDGWGFFHDQVRPIVEERIAVETTDEQEGLTLDGARRLNPEWERLVAEETKKLTGERFEAHQKALTAAEKVVSSEEFDAELARQLKPTTPTSIVDSVGRRISTLFGGASTEERQQVALNSIRNHYFATDAKALAEFNEEYRSTGNVRNAVDWAELVTNTSLADYERKTVTIDRVNSFREVVRTNAEGNIVKDIVPLTIETDIYDTGARGEQRFIVGETALSQDITEDEHGARVRRISTQFNLVEHPNRMLTGNGLAAWREHLRTDENLKRENGDQILPNTVRTVKEYNAMLDNFNTWLNENENYLKPDSITLAMRQSSVDAWMRSTDFLEKSDNLDRTNYWSLRETEEYRLAERYYYESLTPQGATVTKPDEYDDKYLPAIIAGEEFHGTYAALSEGDDLDGTINKGLRDGTITVESEKPDTPSGSDELTQVGYIPGSLSDPAVIDANRAAIPDGEPASLIALREELEALPEPLNRELSVMSPTARQKEENLREKKSELEDKINNWEEYQVDLIEKLEEKITEAKEGNFRSLYFDRTTGLGGIPGPNTVSNYERYVQGLKDELEQFRKFNQSETDTNNFVEPTPSLLVSADPK